MASSSSFSSSFSTTPQWNYDLFLSFRGGETRKNFTGHLYSALVQAGIRTFRDDELRRGEDITTELLEAIKQSRISLIIFSTNYGASSWCLDELVAIVQCRKDLGQIVLPIFYNIDPCNVREQTGSFGEGFSRHQKVAMDKIERWRIALTEAANLCGLHLQNDANGHEQEFIRKIVQEVFNRLNDSDLSVIDHPVGIDSRIKAMMSLLSIGLDDVRFIGIYGMGGIGKTTIAKVIRNHIRHRFDGSSLLEDVTETTKQPTGLGHLQKKLLYDILKMKDIQISDIDGGINMIRNRLRYKRVLLILDGVNHLDQLNGLARERDWFGAGSRIIITTRNEHLLNVVKVDAKYMVPELDPEESLQLFSWNGFQSDHPIAEYVELSNAVLEYCGGLPLALKVLGSFLSDKTKSQWSSALEKLKEMPNFEIQKILKLSYDSLDDEEREIFLDIACFFIGMDEGDVIRIFDGCGFYSAIGVRELADRCLVTKSKDNKLGMHDLLRDMGRGIVHEESPRRPGNRSRLWYYKDSHQVLTGHKGTQAVEGITLNMPEVKMVRLDGEAFAEMQELRLLHLNGVDLNKGYEHISKNLRWLCWHGFPLKSIPNNLYLENLVVLDMRYSMIKEVWSGIKVLVKLKVLDLSHCHHLTKTPDFSGLVNLEKLLLEDCTSLVMVHQSIGNLERLVLLDLVNCRNLLYLPASFFKLKSLEILDLSGCSKLDEGFRSLCLCKSSLFSRILSFLSAAKFWNSNHQLASPLPGFHYLKSFYIANCNLSDDAISNINFESLPCLEYLNLSGNNFQHLPPSISHHSKLECILLNHCTRLQSIPELPSSLILLIAEHCPSLERISDAYNLQLAPSLRLHDYTQRVPINIHDMYKLESVILVDKEWLSSGSRSGRDYFNTFVDIELLELSTKMEDVFIVMKGIAERVIKEAVCTPEVGGYLLNASSAIQTIHTMLNKVMSLIFSYPLPPGLLSNNETVSQAPMHIFGMLRSVIPSYTPALDHGSKKSRFPSLDIEIPPSSVACNSTILNTNAPVSVHLPPLIGSEIGRLIVRPTYVATDNKRISIPMQVGMSDSIKSGHEGPSCPPTFRIPATIPSMISNRYMKVSFQGRNQLVVSGKIDDGFLSWVKKCGNQLVFEQDNDHCTQANDGAITISPYAYSSYHERFISFWFDILVDMDNDDLQDMTACLQDLIEVFTCFIEELTSYLEEIPRYMEEIARHMEEMK